MSRRHDISDATGIIEQYLPLGRVQSWRDTGGTSPTNAVQGHAPGAIWQDLINGNLWINKGTFASSLWIPLTGGVLYSNTAASTAITNTATETAFSTNFTIPANMLRAGAVLKIHFAGIQTAENGADTLAIKLYIGGLTGTSLISIAAAAGAANNIFRGDANLIIRTAGSAGTFVGDTDYTSVPAASGASGTPVYTTIASTAINTTVSQLVTASATWSAADPGDSVRMDSFTVGIM